MKKILLILLFPLTLLSQTNQPSKEELLLQKGEDYYFKDKYRKARKYYSAAIKINPTVADSYVKRAIAYMDGNKDKKAEIDLEKALSIDSMNLNVLNAFGLLAAKRNNTGLAIRYFTKVLSIDSTDYDAYSNRGPLYLELENYALAKSDILNAIRLNPDSTADDDYLNLCDLYMETGQYRAALDAVNKSIRIAPGFRGGYEHRADVYDHLFDNTNAAADRRTAKKLRWKKKSK